MRGAIKPGQEVPRPGFVYVKLERAADCAGAQSTQVLLNLQQLNIKQQRGVRRNDAACTAGPVAQ